MKNLILIALAFLLMTPAQAAQKADSDYSLLDLNFAAPIVYGDPLNTNSRVGSIVYEMGTNTFRGLFADGTWRTVSQGFIAPTVQRFTSGSGTYTTPDGVLYITVEMVGGGGGGRSSGSGSSQNSGSNGSTTTFGTSLLIAPGGNGGVGLNGGAVATNPTINSPAVEMVSVAGAGGNATVGLGDVGGVGGPNGGVSYFGSAGRGTVTGAGGNAVANSGSGGGAPGSDATAVNASSGGAGSYLKAVINTPEVSYTYSVGAGGAGGAAGTSGQAGGDGGSGVIIVTEYYQ